ncbi:hypothetical protein BBO99_00006636 [Phytophthora kernoviae]|nr:hypothetical protein JM16_005468 [Phytophthora kernoviae]RLN77583.1 hypothetical protein BBO99_00006636 [Phytophthora kernoviae]
MMSSIATYKPLDKQCSFKRQIRESGMYRCNETECDREFNRKYTLAEHIKTHTGERPHVCPVRTCGKRFSTSGNLSRHKRLHGYIEPLKCPVQDCICTFPSNNKLEKHMKFHYGGAVKVCVVPGCGKTFSTTGNLNRHLKNHHRDLEAAATCSSPIPSKLVASDKALHNHLNTIMSSSAVTLKSTKSCGFKRQLTGATAVHMCTEPGCKRQFTRKYTLVEHAKTHTGEKPHVCPVRTCGKRFSTSGNLSRHKRLHGYIEPLKCPVQSCICTFPSTNKLEKHMKFHYGSANKICEVPGCGKTFSTTGNLNRHLKNQHGHQHEAPVTTGLPMLKHGASSPTSTEQWYPFSVAPVDPFYTENMLAWPSSSSSTGLFEDAWNPTLLDTLVNIFDDQGTFSC